jgi:hypothetical protein
MKDCALRTPHPVAADEAAPIFARLYPHDTCVIQRAASAKWEGRALVLVLGKVMLAVVIDADSSVEEGVDAFVVPVCPRRRFEAANGAAVDVRSIYRIVEDDPPALDVTCQRTEQR